MTGKKDDAVEVTKASELALGEPVVIDSDTFHFHMRAIKSATERKDTAVSLVRGCLKAANQVNKKLGATLQKMITLERKDDMASLREELELFGIALKETGSPIQLTIHNALLGDVTEVAYKRGFEAGAAGKTLNNPYPSGSDLAEQFALGWQHGTAKNLGMSPEQADAAVSDRPAGEGHNSEMAEEPALKDFMDQVTGEPAVAA